MSSYYEKFSDGRVVCIDEEIPFEIPQGWEWCRLQDVCSYIQRGKSPIYSDVKMYPVIAQKCNQWTGFSIEKAQFINPATINKYAEERIIQDHDLLWNSTGLGTLGRMAIYEEIKNPYKWAVADSHVTVIRPLHQFVSYDFLYSYFASSTVQNVIEDKSEGSTKQKELYVDTVKTYLIPLPPNAEQKKISQKINLVLPVVSRYEERQVKLDTLNKEISAKLQKSILQEAIQGRLVPQVLTDEPASVLLDRIAAEKQQLVKEGKLKAKDAIASAIFKGDDNKYYEKTEKDIVDITEEIPFEIPSNWCWSRATSIAQIIMGQSPDGESINTSNGIEFHQGKIHFTDKYLAVAPYYTSAPSKYAEPLSLLLCVRAPVGVANITERRICIGRGLCALNFYKGINLDLMFYFFATFKKYYEDLATGSTFKAISKDIVSNTLIPIPPEQEQIRIIEMIQSLYTKTA